MLLNKPNHPILLILDSNTWYLMQYNYVQTKAYQIGIVS